tara:strand:- start:7648 stop:8541 length:894 start_codon:yes stop_codon:yes gene_type:complete
MSKQNIIIAALVSLLIAVGILLLVDKKRSEPTPAPQPEPTVEELTVPTTTTSVIGSSVEGRTIEVHTFGTGENDLLLVGGFHGGYEYNTIILAHEMIDYFRANPGAVPENVTVHIVPNLNPDGLFIATGLEGRFEESDITDYSMHTSGAGRFNANDVDLNRNFDCRWVDSGVWRGNAVSAGTAPFSEPEAVAIRDYVMQTEPKAAIFWHSKAGNVYGAECNNGIVDEGTLTLMRTYANASGYGSVPVFDAYVVTGAMEDWLTSIGIPAVTVEFTTRTSSEFEANLAGTLAVLQQYAE